MLCHSLQEGDEHMLVVDSIFDAELDRTFTLRRLEKTVGLHGDHANPVALLPLP